MSHFAIVQRTLVPEFSLLPWMVFWCLVRLDLVEKSFPWHIVSSQEKTSGVEVIATLEMSNGEDNTDVSMG